uniref:Uncharacterized protein n=1 Tax=Anabas testudineus TaxID=64144 RepID=A0A7N6BT24_ANATE
MTVNAPLCLVCHCLLTMAIYGMQAYFQDTVDNRQFSLTYSDLQRSCKQTLFVCCPFLYVYLGACMCPFISNADMWVIVFVLPTCSVCQPPQHLILYIWEPILP